MQRQVTIADWLVTLSFEYGKEFSQGAAEIIREVANVATINTSLNQQQPIVNTKDFVPVLVNKIPVLKGMHLANLVGGGMGNGDIPWQEEAVDEKSSERLAHILGNTRLSVDVHECIHTACEYLDSTHSGEVITEWHLSLAILESGAKGVTWFLGHQNISAEQVIEQLFSNLEEKNPHIYEELNSLEFVQALRLEEASLEHNGISRRAAITNFNQSISGLQKEANWSNELNVAFDRLKEVQQWLIQEAPGYIGGDDYIALSRVPKICSPESIILVLLLTSKEQAKGLRALPDSVNLDWAHRVNKTLNFPRKKLLTILQRVLGGEYKSSEKTESGLPTVDAFFLLRVGEMQKLAQKISTNIIDVRHFLSVILSNDLVSDLEAEGISKQVLLSALKGHVKESGVAVHDLGKLWESIFQEIEAGASITKVEKNVGVSGEISGNYEPVENEEVEDSAHEISSTKKKTQQNTSTGKGGSYNRESTAEELGGDVLAYARAISRVFKSASKDDFCFALFGRWGRGKTTLINEVQKQLEDDYEHVRFNAWKYPKRPEVWVHLYETIKIKASQSSVCNKIRLALQSNLLKDKGVPLLFGGITALIAAVPKAPLLKEIYLSQILSLSSVIMVILYFTRLWRGFGACLGGYMTFPEHTKELGLQAAVGDELKRLIKVWVKESEQKTRLAYIKKQLIDNWGFTLGVVLVAISSAMLIHHLTKGIPVWGIIASYIGLVTVFVSGIWVALSPPRQTEQILLVVDDLDRCPAKEMLSVVESIRVFLDDDEISPCLRVAMLLDRDIFAQAVEGKYEGLAKRRDSQDIINEQLEKFFLLSFDLPELESVEVYEIGSKIIKKKTSDEVAAHEIRTAEKKMGVKSNQAKTPKTTIQALKELQKTNEREKESSLDVLDSVGELEQVQSGEQNPLTIKSDDAKDNQDEVSLVELEEHEKDELLEIFMSHQVANSVTPRKMRAIKMRYFLIREVLEELNLEFSPKEICQHLMAIKPKEHFNDKLSQVIQMVTGKKAIDRPESK